MKGQKDRRIDKLSILRASAFGAAQAMPNRQLLLITRCFNHLSLCSRPRAGHCHPCTMTHKQCMSVQACKLTRLTFWVAPGRDCISLNRKTNEEQTSTLQSRRDSWLVPNLLPILSSRHASSE